MSDQEHAEELAILEALDVGKPVTVARAVDVATVCTAVVMFPLWFYTWGCLQCFCRGLLRIYQAVC